MRKELSLNQRKTELTLLIKDSESLCFDCDLIASYKIQLLGIEKEITAIKNKQKIRRLKLKESLNR